MCLCDGTAVWYVCVSLLDGSQGPCAACCCQFMMTVRSSQPPRSTVSLQRSQVIPLPPTTINQGHTCAARLVAPPRSSTSKRHALVAIGTCMCICNRTHAAPPPPPMPAPKQSTVITHSFPSKAQGSDPLPPLLVPPPQHISTIIAYSFSPISPLSLHNSCRCHHSHSYSFSPISPSTWLVQAATRPSVSSSWLSWSRARPQKVPLVNSACADGRERGGGGGGGWSTRVGDGGPTGVQRLGAGEAVQQGGPRI